MSVDLSKCVEASAGYYSYMQTSLGHIIVQFDGTGNDYERIYGKDPTCCVTQSVFYLEYFQINCATGGVSLLDGSNYSSIFGDFRDSSSPRKESWDFRKDPLRCLTGCFTESLSIAVNNGFYQGILMGYWGPD